MNSSYRTTYGLQKALRQPNMSGEIVVFLKKDENSELSQLGQFHKLRSLILLDGKDLTDLPPEILQLSRLEKLRIRGTGIKHLPEELGNLTYLRHLIIEDTPIKSLPDSLGRLQNFSVLEIDRTLLECLPESFANLKELYSLQITNSKLNIFSEAISEMTNLSFLNLKDNNIPSLPDSIRKLRMVTRMNLGGNFLESLPDAFCELRALLNLDLSYNKLKSLPESFSNFSNLKFLSLNNNSFSDFPDVVCNCKKLFALELASNQLTSIPYDIYKLSQLKNFNIQKNNFTSFPPALFNWYSYSACKSTRIYEWGFRLEKSFSNGKKTDDFLANKLFKSLPRDEQLLCFNIFCNHNSVLQKMNILSLYYGLNSRVPIVSDNVLDFLTAQQAPDINVGDEILILGKTTRKKSELTKQLKNCGLKYTTKIKDSTTHVLISSRSNKGLEKLPPDIHWNWIIESELINYLDKIQPTYLLEEQSKEGLIHIENLIMSLDEENMSLALQLIEGGGLPEELLTEVFIVFKLSDWAETRKKAKNLLMNMASVEELKVLKNRSMIRFKRNWFSRDDLKKIKSKLKDFTQFTSFSIGKIAFALSVKYHILFDYALDFASDKYKMLLLNNYLIKEDVFKMGYDDLLERFPLIILEIKNLRSISISIKRYDYIGPFEKGKTFIIPDEISTLINLEELSITYNRLESLPVDALCKLTKLKKLTLMVNRSIDVSKLKKALPDCEFNLWHG
jgi:Leucine-rich repeat (LRR) protein